MLDFHQQQLLFLWMDHTPDFWMTAKPKTSTAQQWILQGQLCAAALPTAPYYQKQSPQITGSTYSCVCAERIIFTSVKNLMFNFIMPASAKGRK